MMFDAEIFDVVIIGAGIGGIDIAYRLQESRPGCSFTLLEARTAIGGTWDVFRYPGVRSDSDLYSYGLPWHPWTGSLIPEGASIRSYLEAAAIAQGIDRHIRFNHAVSSANWCGEDQTWTIETTGSTKRVRSRFLVFATGLFDLTRAPEPVIPGLHRFQGQVIHPMQWPEDVDYAGQKVVIIGSGATAVTLLPAMVEQAAQVTMLQRSPSYVLSIPSRDFLCWLPFRMKRLLWLSLNQVFVTFVSAFPRLAGWFLCSMTRRALSEKVPVDPHFTPRYRIGSQRVCGCPDGDLFHALARDNADIRTTTIRSVTESGIALESGDLLDADLIVTATGQRMQIGGGVRITIDGDECVLGDKFFWNGSMVEDVPNAFFVVGYPSVPWIMGVEVTAQRIVRVLKYMYLYGYRSVVPRMRPEQRSMGIRPFYNLESTYIRLGRGETPKNGDVFPWKPRSNFLVDYLDVTWGSVGRDLHFH